MKKIERRAFECDQMVLVRAEGDEKKAPTIRGHAAVFNVLSPVMWGFREKIAPGAFAESIGQDDVRCLFNHNADYVLGRNRAKPVPTLRLSEDATGLFMECDPPDTQVARDLIISIDRGDVSQQSFAFRVIDELWEHDEATGIDIRTLVKAKLYDVSPVTYPAYPDTDVSARSLEEIAAEGKRRLKSPEEWRHENERLQRKLRLMEASA